MRLTEIENAQQLAECMTEPTPNLIEMAAALDGDLLVLGAGGKMGPDLVETMVRADREAGVPRRIFAADLFPGDLGAQAAERLTALGAETVHVDLTQPNAMQGLPPAPNVVYMVGFKFGSSEDPGFAVQMNCIVPADVAMGFTQSRILVFSSTNPYAPVPPESGGSREDDLPAPRGLYGWTVLGREMAFRAVASGHAGLRVCYYRLAYAQHLNYGVLVDLARMINAGEQISLGMPYVNLLSQRDAIERALLGLTVCTNPPAPLNVAGPPYRVREIAEKLGAYLGKPAQLADDEGTSAAIANDQFCRELFGEYRDSAEEMIEAAAKWVAAGGEYWGKPTMFGVVAGKY